MFVLSPPVEACVAAGAAGMLQIGELLLNTCLLLVVQRLPESVQPHVSSYDDFNCMQVEVYKHVLRSKSVAALMSGRASEPSDGVLSIITSLRKLCNHPDLLHCSSGTALPPCIFAPLLLVRLQAGTTAALYCPMPS